MGVSNLDSVIPTGADDREAMICGVEGPAVLLTITLACLSLKVFGERRLVSQSPERSSGLWLSGTNPPLSLHCTIRSVTVR